MMKTRAPSLVTIALLFAAAACKDSSGPRPVLSACSDTTSGALDLTTLAPGGVAVATGSQVACVRVPPAGASGAEYVFAVTDVDTKLDVSQGYTFDAHPLSGAVADVAAPSLVARAAVADVGAAPTASFASAREAAIRAYERAHLRGPSAAASGGGQLGAGVRATVAAAVPTVGQTLTFRVPSTDLNVDACTTYDSLTAVVKYVGTSSIVAQDLNAPASGFTDADFQAIANEFDTKIYATDVSYFGNPSDIDVNGKVVLLFTPLINKATPKGSQSFFAGFFFAGDLFPRTASSSQTSCKESNVGELFYLLVPDPTGSFGDARSVSTVRQITRGTVAHEFQHMINAGVRLPDPNAAFEETWLDEALSHLAEEVVGRDERGYADLQELNFADVTVSSADYSAFFQQNLVRFKYWLQHPDTSAGPSKHADVNLSSRGAAWALVRYTADQYSAGDVRGFTRRLVVGPETGLANLTARAGTSYETILTGWDVANYADNLGIAGLDPRYEYPSWAMRNAETMAGTSYPLLVTTISSSGTTAVGKMISGAAAYFRWSAAGTAPGLGVRLLNGNANAAATWTGARLVVLRVR